MLLTVFELVGDDDLRQLADLAVGRHGADADRVDGVRLESGDLRDGVRPDLDAQPALEVGIGVQAVVDAVPADAAGRRRRRRIPANDKRR